MKNRLQPWAWSSRAYSRSTDAALVLAIVVVLAMIAIPSGQAQTFTVLYNFTGASGAWPYPTLSRDSA